MRRLSRYTAFSASALKGSLPCLCESRAFLSDLPPPPTQRAAKAVTSKKRRAGKLPPPPPLPGTTVSSLATVHATGSAGRSKAELSGEATSETDTQMASSGSGAVFSWAAPQLVLSTLIEYIPTFFVPIQSVAAILEDEGLRASVTGRGRFQQLLRRFPFLFELRLPDTGGGGYRAEVRLHADVDHPRRGAADDKYMMTDVGETTYFVAKPELVVWSESIDKPTQQNVRLGPVRAPPAVRVSLEDRPPVLERLVSLIPDSFTAIDALEDSIPKEVLFDPYFDCQGGLAAIVGKFPEDFQLVGERVRRRPPYLAPLALDELTLAHSPLPDVAALVQREVCDGPIPHWVNVTSLYEQLSSAQRRALKQHGFKSLSGFLRAHGGSVAVSSDMLSVSMWMTAHPAPPPRSDAEKNAEKNAALEAHNEGDHDRHHHQQQQQQQERVKRSPRSPGEALAALEAATEDAYLAAARAQRDTPSGRN